MSINGYIRVKNDIENEIFIEKSRFITYVKKTPLEEDAKVFCEKAKAYDLILVPGDSFGCPGYFRMAYCIDTEKVERSLVALRKFVEAEYSVK